jgi:hypothetical protein
MNVALFFRRYNYFNKLVIVPLENPADGQGNPQPFFVGLTIRRGFMNFRIRDFPESVILLTGDEPVQCFLDTFIGWWYPDE